MLESIKWTGHIHFSSVLGEFEKMTSLVIYQYVFVFSRLSDSILFEMA